MNVGYANRHMVENPISEEICPICGKNIYVDKYGYDFACVDINCPLGHGAREIMNKINVIFNWIKHD